MITEVKAPESIRAGRGWADDPGCGGRRRCRFAPNPAPHSPGSGASGDAFLGLHFYTWSFLISALIIVGSACMLLLDGQFARTDGRHSFTGLTIPSFATF